MHTQHKNNNEHNWPTLQLHERQLVLNLQCPMVTPQHQVFTKTTHKPCSQWLCGRLDTHHRPISSKTQQHTASDRTSSEPSDLFTGQHQYHMQHWRSQQPYYGSTSRITSVCQFTSVHQWHHAAPVKTSCNSCTCQPVTARAVRCRPRVSRRVA